MLHTVSPDCIQAHFQAPVCKIILFFSLFSVLSKGQLVTFRCLVDRGQVVFMESNLKDE